MAKVRTKIDKFTGKSIPPKPKATPPPPDLDTQFRDPVVGERFMGMDERGKEVERIVCKVSDRKPIYAWHAPVLADGSIGTMTTASGESLMWAIMTHRRKAREAMAS